MPTLADNKFLLKMKTFVKIKEGDKYIYANKFGEHVMFECTTKRSIHNSPNFLPKFSLKYYTPGISAHSSRIIVPNSEIVEIL